MNSNRRTLLGVAVVLAATVSVFVALPAPGNDGAFVQTNQAAQTGWSVEAHGWERNIVRVKNVRCHDVIEGTGVIIDGAVVTNAHVIAEGSEVTVTTFDGTVYRAISMSRSNVVDVGRIEIDRDPQQGADRGLEIEVIDVDDLISSANGSLANSSMLAGFPAASRLSVRQASPIAEIVGFPPADPALAAQLDVEVVGGESGSPLISPDGMVVGLLYGRATSDGSGLVVSGADLVAALDRLTAVEPAPCGV